jgi:hypothetical protein
MELGTTTTEITKGVDKRISAAPSVATLARELFKSMVATPEPVAAPAGSSKLTVVADRIPGPHIRGKKLTSVELINLVGSFVDNEDMMWYVWVYLFLS